jgi:hypothetical protein
MIWKFKLDKNKLGVNIITIRREIYLYIYFINLKIGKERGNKTNSDHKNNRTLYFAGISERSEVYSSGIQFKILIASDRITFSPVVC